MKKIKKKNTGSKLTSDTNIELSETDINYYYYVKSIKWEDGEFQRRTGKQDINQMASQELTTKTL